MENKNIIYLSEHLDSSFEINDITKIFNAFERTFVLTYNKKCKKILGCEYIYIEQKTNSKNKIKIETLKQIVLDSISSKKNLIYLSNYKQQISHFLKCAHIATILEKLIIENNLNSEDTLIYSFWCGDFNLAASILKLNQPKFKLISRIHGTDLYEERVPKLNRIAFRSFQLKQNNRIISVSKKGENYLKEKYPEYITKFRTNYLGIQSNKFINPIPSSDCINIISCAHVRNIKRIHLIAESLINSTKKIKWYHIGNSKCTDETSSILNNNLKRLSNNKHVEIIFLGILTQKEIFKFYKTIPINCFISLSETEGLPISMTEAISFGVPILSTDVGGCNEIVNTDTGILIDKNIPIESITKKIESFDNKKWTSIEKRKEIKQFCETNFNSDENFKTFLKQNILSL
jgi:glycosyltransferase involved in cell wall biosynthesis